ncbi:MULTISPECIES: Smr/MutS family protein [Niastella]|uniref:Smr/MutS family protein n=1 Tax=Niastella soli TaxID=2821487 RepID=A0ABS3Z0E4_9BACT|nr:Smr/MutS family protein [Niastella soli]MBO9203639.1 Smr/MutS family protein [Niastella soli]
MKFEVGDKVVVNKTNEEGEVIEIINDKMVMVEVRGVKFPAYVDQLDFPYFKRFTEQKLFSPKKEKKFIDDVPREKKKITQRVVDGVWLTFIPISVNDEFGDDIVTELKVHLVNRTELDYKFTYKLTYGGNEDFELVNSIRAFEDFYLHDVPFENLNDNPAFGFEFSLVTPLKLKADYFEHTLKLKPKQVFTRIEEVRKKGEATFSYKLFEEYPPRPYEEEKSTGLDLGSLAKAGFKIYDASKVRQNLEAAKSELDLHIEALTPAWESMSNLEILDLQLKTFEKYFDLAVVHHLPWMIVIHGVGTGKLRDEIHEILKLRKEVKSFTNRYHPAYGYGATEIYFGY